MNKGEFVSYIANKHGGTKADAERIIDIFTASVMGAMADGEDISLVGFGNFNVVNIVARDGRNPRTGEVIKIQAYKKPKFKPGQKLKDACN